jgi:D-alanine--poly(phosphoribitol) ligase subunit 1
MNFNLDTLQFENAGKEPGKLAFAGSDGDLTWHEFEAEVKKLCSVFKETGLPKGHPVLIYGHKEKLFPVAITASLTYGVPYIPVDTVMPLERVKRICEISGTQLMINCAGKAIDAPVTIQINPGLKKNGAGKADFSKAIYTHSIGPMAYIMFTSGSTGEPKGVMIPLQSVRSLVHWMERDYPVDAQTVFMNQAPFSFDISMVELYSTLQLGGTTVLNDNAVAKNEKEFIDRLKKYNCTFWNSTPSFAYTYLTSQLFSEANLPKLKHFLFAGEELTARLVQRLKRAFPTSKVYNAYGPTEATYTNTFIEITDDILEKYSALLPIGYTKWDSKMLVENESGNEEEEGELVIVGDNVGAGYLNREDLTTTKFTARDNMRAFKTGDYGYKRGELVFFTGRRDDQVKLNGYRIEIGDINRHLEEIPFIAEAVTVPLKVGTTVKKIVAFARLRDKAAANKEELKASIAKTLATKLPAYMVPSDIVFLDAFPVNVNHKIDKLKLVEMYTA